MLTCNNLTFAYNEKIIFKNFSISLFPNSILILKGRNGSGKTSLLRMIAGLVKPSEGELLWNGENIYDNIYDYRSLINYIGHNKSQKNPLSVFENMRFWGELAQAELIIAAIHYFGLADYADIYYNKLSAGLKQRVELTRLMTKVTPIWLLDEPENNLDKKGKELLMNLVISRAEQGGIVIIATHNDFNLNNSFEINLDEFR